MKGFAMRELEFFYHDIKGTYLLDACIDFQKPNMKNDLRFMLFPMVKSACLYVDSFRNDIA